MWGIGPIEMVIVVIWAGLIYQRTHEYWYWKSGRRPYFKVSNVKRDKSMFGIGPMELVIVGIIALLVFGNRLPEVARSLGKGIVEFKKGVKGIDD